MFRIGPNYVPVLAVAFSCWVGLTQSVIAQSPAPTEEVSSFERIAEAAVAASLKLTDKQTAAVKNIVAEREAAVGAAGDAAGKAQARTDANAKLKALLTPEQQRIYSAVFAGKTLRFNFRAQKWDDILDYVADEAGLSLVMAETPPGVFNYSDNKDYSPTEAIDLLNGWLQTKGFTLIRRDRLLMCLNIKDGLPQTAIPRIMATELPTRGNFELVRVLIPLEGRPADAVVKEVTPLLGTYGTIEPLAATSQVLLTDTAGNVKALATIIKQIPLPKAPPAKPKPKPPVPKPKPIPPVLTVYPIKHANPAKASEILGKFVAGTIYLDENANQISINAIPTEHAKVVGILKKLEDNQGPDKQPRLQMYPISTRKSEEILANIKLAVSNAELRIDESGRNLVAWASPQDQANIASILNLIGGETGVGPRQVQTQLETYTVKRVSAAVAMGVLSELLPDARMSVNDANGTLVVVGSLTDHQAVQAMIEQIDAIGDATEKPTLIAYPSHGIPAATLSSLVSSIAPDATVTFNESGDTALIMATPDDHVKVKPTIEQLHAATARPAAELKTYPAESVDVASVTALLATLVPKATVTTDTLADRLIVIGSVADHVTVANVLEQVGTSVAAAKQLKTYPMNGQVDTATLVTVLTTLAPDAQITNDLVNRRILVVADEKDQTTIAKTLAALHGEPAAPKPVVTAYKVGGIPPATLTSLVTSIAPDSTLTFDVSGESALVLATAEDHAKIKPTIEQLMTATARPESEVTTYPIKNVDVASVTSLLATLAPKATVTTDTLAERLIVIASAEDHLTVAKVLAQMGEVVANDRLLKSYPLNPQVDAVATVAMLAALAPRAEVTHDAINHRLFVVAAEDDHATVAKNVDAMNRELPLDLKTALAIYPITKVDAASVSEVLTTIFPDVSITLDAKGSRLLVKARSTQQMAIKSAIEQLDSETAAASSLNLIVYSTEGMESATVSEVISSELPDVTIIPDTTAETLIIRARLKQHERIAEILESMKSTSVEKKRKVVVYPQTLGTSATAIAFITKSWPGSTVAADRLTGRLTIAATENQHTEIRAAIDAMKVGAKIKSYSVEGAQATQLSRLLTTAVAGAKFVFSDDSTKLVAWGTEAEHESIAAIVAGSSAPRLETLKTYSTTGLGGSVSFVLSAEVPQASVNPGTRADQLIVRATADEHKTIDNILTLLQDASSKHPQRTLATFDIDGANPEMLTGMLQPLLDDDAVMTMDEQSGKMFIRAFPHQHETIANVVKEVIAAIPNRKGVTTKTYRTSRGDADEIEEAIQAKYPQVVIFTNGGSEMLIATALPEEHAAIEEAVSAMLKGATGDMETRLYDVTNLDGEALETALEVMFARTGFVTEFDEINDKLITVATSEQHVQMAKIVEDLKTANAAAPKRSLVAYNIDQQDPDAVQAVLEPLVDDTVQITFDPTGRRIFVRATEEKQVEVAQLISQVVESLPSRAAAVTKTYRTKRGDADEVQEALTALLPAATLVTDSDRAILLATALPDEHLIIENVVTEMNLDANDTKKLTTKVYPVVKADGEVLEDTITRMFRVSLRDGPYVRASFDEKSRKLVVVAQDDQHEVIAQLISQVEEQAEPKANQRLDFYALESSAGKSASAVVSSLLETIDPNANVILDDGSNQLIVTTTDPGHAAVKQTVEKLNPVTTLLKVYDLKTADGEVLEAAITQMYRLEKKSVRATFDERSNKLMVVARSDQHDAIEKIVQSIVTEAKPDERQRMEFYSVKDNDGDSAEVVISNLLETIDSAADVVLDDGSRQLIVTTTDIGHQRVSAAIEKLGKMTPRDFEVFQLDYLDAMDAQFAVSGMFDDGFSDERDLPLVSSDEDSQQLLVRATPDQIDQIRKLLIKMGETGLAISVGNSTSRTRTISIDGDVGEAMKRIEKIWPRIRKNPIRILQPSGIVPSGSVPGDDCGEDPQVQPEANDETTSTETGQEAGNDLQPILVVPGNGTVTISSDDIEALNQMEAILNAVFSRRTTRRNKDFEVYQLQNAGAQTVADTLLKIFSEDNKYSITSGNVVIVPDQRLNALIVFSNRNDRASIEALIETLDSEFVPDTLATSRTQVVPIQNADAGRIADVLRDIYKAQIESGGSRQSVTIPKGVPASVASVVRSMNANLSAPLLNIAVEETTNSLILVAPKNLLEDVLALIEQLDEASGTSRAHGIRVLRLKKTNSSRVMDALGDVLGSGSVGASSRTRKRK